MTSTRHLPTHTVSFPWWPGNSTSRFPHKLPASFGFCCWFWMWALFEEPISFPFAIGFCKTVGPGPGIGQASAPGLPPLLLRRISSNRTISGLWVIDSNIESEPPLIESTTSTSTSGGSIHSCVRSERSGSWLQSSTGGQWKLNRSRTGSHLDWSENKTHDREISLLEVVSECRTN